MPTSHSSQQKCHGNLRDCNTAMIWSTQFNFTAAYLRKGPTQTLLCLASLRVSATAASADRHAATQAVTEPPGRRHEMSTRVTEAAAHVDAATKTIAEYARPLRPEASAWKNSCLHRDRRSPTRSWLQMDRVTGMLPSRNFSRPRASRVNRHGICRRDRIAGLTVTRFRRRLGPREFSATKFMAQARAKKFP